jgi:hypothetical protein
MNVYLFDAYDAVFRARRDDYIYIIDEHIDWPCFISR